jgi:hypothetical protein
MPGNALRELVQMTFSVLAWFFFYAEFSRRITGKNYQFLFAFGIVILSTSSAVVQWETVLLGTSLQISTVIFIVTLVAKLNGDPKNLIVIFGLEFVTFLLGVQKASNILFCLVIFGTTLKLAWDHLPTLRKVVHSSLISIILVLIVITGLNVDKSWPSTYSGYTLLWQLGGQSPVAADFKNYLHERRVVPECVYKDAPFKDLNLEIGKVVNDCEGGANYVATKLKRDFIGYTVTHPLADVKLATLGFGATYTNSSSHYGPSVQLLPNSLSQIFFGDVNPDHRFSNSSNQVDAFKLLGTGEPLWLYVPGIFWSLAGIGLAFHRRKCVSESRLPKLLGTVQINLLLNALLVFVILPSEWVRQSSPFLISSIALGFFSTLFVFSDAISD